jgi:hypothetical protein
VPCGASRGRRARNPENPEIRGDGHFPGAVDEISKPMVVALLRTPVVMRIIIGGSLVTLNLSLPKP